MPNQYVENLEEGGYALDWFDEIEPDLLFINHEALVSLEAMEHHGHPFLHEHETQAWTPFRRIQPRKSPNDNVLDMLDEGLYWTSLSIHHLSIIP